MKDSENVIFLLKHSGMNQFSCHLNTPSLQFTLILPTLVYELQYVGRNYYCTEKALFLRNQIFPVFTHCLCKCAIVVPFKGTTACHQGCTLKGKTSKSRNMHISTKEQNCLPFKVLLNLLGLNKVQNLPFKGTVLVTSYRVLKSMNSFRQACFLQTTWHLWF